MSFDAKSYLKQLAVELHKPAKKKFPRQKIYVPEVMHTWSIDIADMNEYKDENNNIRFMLTCIDTFSRKANAVPIKDKTPKVVLAGFKKHVKFYGGTPKYIYCDQGSEFKAEFEKYCDSKNIKMYHTFALFKASPIERFHRTLKDRLNMQFTQAQSHRWIDILDETIGQYNNSKHSAIKMTPNKAFEKKNHDKVYENQYGKIKAPPANSKPLYELGDKVRVSRVKGTFEKSGYNWSQEIFTINRRDLNYPYRYWLKDEKNEQIQGSFYEPELQKTLIGDVFLVEKVVDTKTVNRVKYSLVKWLGYSDNHNQWIADKELKDLK